MEITRGDITCVAREVELKVAVLDGGIHRVNYEDRADADSRPRSPPGPQRVLPTDPVFDLTSQLALLRRTSMRRFVRAVIIQRNDLRVAFRRIRSLPRLTVELTSDPASRDLTHKLRKGFGPFRYRTWAVAVLEIPEQAGALRKGRSRRSVRYNIAKAVTDGATCEILSGRDAILCRFSQVVVDGWGVDRQSWTYRRWTRNVEDVPHAMYFAAVGADGATLVFGKVIIAGVHARLHTFIQRDKESATSCSSASRFLLVDFMVESLRTAGVRYLIVDSIVGLPQGLRYYQQLVGYTAWNIVLHKEAVGNARGVRSTGGYWRRVRSMTLPNYLSAVILHTPPMACGHRAGADRGAPASSGQDRS